MNLRTCLSSTSGKPLKTWSFRLAFLVALSAVTVGVVISQTVTLPPEVVLPAEPLYMNGAKTKGNLTLALSVEFPTVGQTYRDEFDKTKEYVGYFDPKACYKHAPGQNNFDWNGPLTAAGECSGSGGAFSGNFMNWATSSAIDILRYGLTGGNRIVDESSGNAQTVLQRAWLPDSFYRHGTYFTEKSITKAQAATLVETALYNKITDGGKLWIYNCRNRVYFAKSRDTNASSACDKPFNVSNAGSDELIGSTSSQKFYELNMLVCDPNSATNRLMTYDPETKQWKGLCFRYPNGKYKPVGQFQMNAENIRIGVLGYLQDNNRSRYGGVLRAPLKYLGPKKYDNNFNLETAANARTEWNANTGVFIDNPQSGDSTYGDQGYPRSGAIMYINKFGTLNPDTIGAYKELDPVSELFYEAIRYLQGKQPTSQAVSGFSGTASTDKALKDNFPAYATWTDPFAGFTDTSGTGNGCLRNSILTIADVFTHSDRSVPGNAVTSNNDFSRSAETSPALDVPFWTSVVGSFESKLTTTTGAITYTDSQGRTQIAGNLSGNTLYTALADAATMNTGATGGSYHMAGLAYWANTQSFRTDLPKGRIKTYSIDVNEGRSSNTVSFRRTQQLYLGAKYGGFDDSANGNTGSPYSGGTNVLWQATDGDAKNYFLVSDAAKFLDSLSEIFARVVEETGSIAGGAISTQRLTVGQAAAVFQARFNPVANYWSGRLLKYPLSLDTAGTSLVIGSTSTWEAGQVMTSATLIDHGAGRNIVIGAPIGQQATAAPTPFKWADLNATHKTQLSTMPYTTTVVIDAVMGEDRLNYVRGDRRKEIKPTTPTAPFRPRDIVLGDIVNSGLVYMGKPSGGVAGTAYNTFFNTNKNRKPVIFANANDGMLHAFYDTNGAEAFAYIPGFVAGKLNLLPDQDYSHISINDATPAIGEAYVDSAWRSVLVSGVGAGGQGIFALDVTDPETFTKDNVLWEFTDRDHPSMGNVIGAPQIVKLRTTDAAITPVYKWYAIVASGVNNYSADGYAHSTGNPAIFILDLSNKPASNSGVAWTEGTNFWRIELPQTSTDIAKGLVGLTTVKNFGTGAVDTIYTGDLQGNVWKLDFTLKGISSLTTNAATNLTKLNHKVGTSTTFFVAKDSANVLQPITGEPVISNAFFDSKLVSFGTGKYLEIPDTTVPSSVTNTFYTLLDNTQAISGRSKLQQGTVSTTGGTVTVPSFVYGMPPATGTSALKMGWYVDFNKSIGERQISDITAEFGQLFFGSLFPTEGSCGEGGGRFYAVNALTGNGTSELSQVGILAAPLVLEIGSAALTNSDTAGQRTATRRIAIITQGSKGLKVAATGGGGLSYNEQVGRLSWRQINNYRENKNN
ncbi:MAG: PilC/PilY family type IV pilus protein [Polaromonas sp.]|uniref:pilus assembly protein n=1 Tax=Polaromonas sp. TaxID=1869339 RepID=UPI002730E2EF|nr:PilC/PilY family type IV pilus protein [Polaromonas sp.]MDP2448636.1 PilC/PilY family type IV pilus protein [Polaromonas sp.]MDP3248248.1 PilC/PilY family type IV pilus protein [Polaromonas sp.]MDP3756466.1 PilC/PilY family type IV pilus protein [Polaromonas sp.]